MYVSGGRGSYGKSTRMLGIALNGVSTMYVIHEYAPIMTIQVTWEYAFHSPTAS